MTYKNSFACAEIKAWYQSFFLRSRWLMSGNYRRFFPKIFSFTRENLNRSDLKFTKPDMLSTWRSFVKDNKHLVTIKSAYSRLGSALNSDIEFSIEKFTSIYDRISGRDSVTKAHGDLLQVCKFYLF